MKATLRIKNNLAGIIPMCPSTEMPEINLICLKHINKWVRLIAVKNTSSKPLMTEMATKLPLIKLAKTNLIRYSHGRPGA